MGNCKLYGGTDLNYQVSGNVTQLYGSDTQILQYSLTVNGTQAAAQQDPNYPAANVLITPAASMRTPRRRSPAINLPVFPAF